MVLEQGRSMLWCRCRLQDKYYLMLGYNSADIRRLEFGLLLFSGLDSICNENGERRMHTSGGPSSTRHFTRAFFHTSYLSRFHQHCIVRINRTAQHFLFGKSRSHPKMPGMHRQSIPVDGRC